MTRLTYGLGASFPAWTPDGRYIAFRTTEGIFCTRSDGSAKPQPLTLSKNRQFPGSFKADGKRLSFSEMSVEGAFSIWTVPLDNDSGALKAGKPEVWMQAPPSARTPRFSTDGRWLAYTSSESGMDEVYVQAFPDKGGKWQISNSGGTYPYFSPNARELFFRNRDNQIMVARYVVKEDSFLVDKPRIWSEKTLANVGNSSNYDLAPDGKRIIALMPVENEGAGKERNHVTFLLNFFDELRRRVPVN
jgi:serine/threonine-protein kinase